MKRDQVTIETIETESEAATRNVYQKLNDARSEFHATAIKKSGWNEYSRYAYFELADFLLPALRIFDKNKLCAVVSFNSEVASMLITDIDDDGSHILITSPFSSASLKACHEVQNVGAVETYQRRYLWIAALEIVEHDALDKVTGKPDTLDEKKNPFTPEPPEIEKTRAGELEDLAIELVNLHEAGAFSGMYERYCTVLDNEEKVFLWGLLKPSSKVRSSIKRMGEQEKLRAENDDATPAEPSDVDAAGTYKGRL